MLALDYGRPNRFGPSRSTVMATQGMVATSQPLAAVAALDVLQSGGNAVDAAVTAAAMLSVLEPMSTGVGGDAFALIHDAKSGQTFCLNGSGRAARAATPEEVSRRLGPAAGEGIPMQHPLAITVPGVVDAWATVLERFGSYSLKDALAPAILAAEKGVAVAPQTALFWVAGEKVLGQDEGSRAAWLIDGERAPVAGTPFRSPLLASTLRAIAEGGRDVFYRGELAEAIVRCVQGKGGLLTLEDLAQHRSDWVEPLAVTYRGLEVLEVPPNSQGIIALEALRILEREDMASLEHNSRDAIHLQIEAVKLAIHDAARHVTDPAVNDIAAALLADGYIGKRHAAIDRERANESPGPGKPQAGDTVYIAVADAAGNCASFINSVFVPWGSGITVPGTGILLQNRGHAFSLDRDHPNIIAPGKRTRHTLTPAMVRYKGRPLMAFGFVGGDMQVQAQVQVLCNLIDFGMGLQDAMDAPRWRYEGQGAKVAVESGIPPETVRSLATRGHAITGHDGFFGGGQAVLVHPESGVLHGASDARRDGCALGY